MKKKHLRAWKRDQEIIASIVAFHNHYRKLPPGCLALFGGLAERHPLRYVRLCHELVRTSPATMATVIALDQAHFGMDSGPESDAGPVPSDMQKDIHSTTKATEPDFMRGFQ